MKLFRLIVFVGISLFAFPVCVQSQDCLELYNRANTLFNSKKYEDALVYYRRAKECDPTLRADCDARIKEINRIIGQVQKLVVSEQSVVIPYQGGDKQIDVKSSGKWNIEGAEDWCKTDAYKKNFVIQCRDVNNSIRDRITTLLVKSGSQYRSVKVIQEGRPEYLEVGATNLSFPANGTEDSITIESNANWDVSSVPSWCKVEKDSLGIRIIVSPNDRVMERTDNIVIVSPSKSVTIKVYQGAGEEHLTLSQNNLVMDAAGDVHYVKVYTDAENWFVGDYPTWMNVQKVGNDSIRVECSPNVPNGEPRLGSVQVRTDRQTVGLWLQQSPRMAQDLIFPDSKIVSGRNFSIGFSASYYMPFVSTSSGGDYVGSVVDYGLGTGQENASYKSAIGYSFGVFADVRLYKNIFLTAGVNFTQIKYKNEFVWNTMYETPLSAYEYQRGEMQNSYTENYSHTMIEVPILASYRFKVNDMSHVQLSLGPVLNFGLSAKMKFSGNSDSETLRRYSSITHQPVDNSNYVRHTGVNTEFNLYQPCVYWEEMYTTGNDAPVPHHNQFQEAPLKKVNCGLRIGAAYEWAGLSFGLSYTCMLTNMAQKNYWENERWTVLNASDVTMKGYKQRINTLEFKLAYTLRYIKFKKNK